MKKVQTPELFGYLLHTANITSFAFMKTTFMKRWTNTSEAKGKYESQRLFNELLVYRVA